MGYLIDKLRFSPAFYRAVARDERGNNLTSRQIAKRGGLSRTEVDRIAKSDWPAALKIIDRYLYGCRTNPFQLRRHVQYAKRVGQARHPKITRGRNAAYFRRLNKVIGAKAQAKAKAKVVEKAGG